MNDIYLFLNRVGQDRKLSNVNSRAISAEVRACPRQDLLGQESSSLKSTVIDHAELHVILMGN